MQQKLTQAWAAAAAGPTSVKSEAHSAAVSAHGIYFDSDDQQAAAQLTAFPAQAEDASATKTAADASRTQLPESFADMFPDHSIIPGTSYSVCFSIGSSCPTSAVFACKDLSTEQHELVAVKVALVDTPPASSDAPCSSQLAREAQLLQQLKQKAGIPTLRKFVPSTLMLTGPNNSSAVSLLEMQLLGPSIETNAQQKYYQYSSQLWKRDALGMLEALETLHSSGLVMGVVHPNSFCQVLTQVHKTQVTEYYYGSKASHVYVSKAASCIKASKGVSSLSLDASNICFASDAALQGRPLTPLDDWESLGYTLLWMATGSLPWAAHFNSMAAAGPLTSEQRQQLAGRRNDLLQDLMDQELLPDFAGMWLSYIATTNSPKGNMKFLRQLITYAAAPAQDPAESEEEEEEAQTVHNSSMSLMSCSNPKRCCSQGAQQAMASTNAKKQRMQVHGINQASTTASAAAADTKLQGKEEQEEVAEE